MSKTHTLGQESWRQDTPSPSHISTTSDTAVLEMTGESIRTEAESRLLYSVVAGAVSGALVAYVIVKIGLTYMDGFVKAGYFPISYVDKGQKLTAMVPMFMTEEERKKTVRGGQK